MVVYSLYCTLSPGPGLVARGVCGLTVGVALFRVCCVHLAIRIFRRSLEGRHCLVAFGS